ncbi:hypothetical protein LX36DRAFT_655156 [Colletotrichum falcatum]|nr:hypothetical protein LX36DRAFT_655156 [Colletotrichum falcatum]
MTKQGSPEIVKQEQPEAVKQVQPVVKQELPVVKQEQLERPADADTATDYGSESEWEGFPDPPAPAAHTTAVVSEAGTGSSSVVVVVEIPAVEGKIGVSALQQSIAHQFPGEPRPATHALLDLLDGPALRGSAGPSHQGNHTVRQLALATRLWFDEYRGKQVRLGVMRKDEDPIIDTSGDRRHGVLWIRLIDGDPSQSGNRPARFCGMSFVPASIRRYEKE